MGVWWTDPGEDRSTQLRAAPSTYPTCHRLLQRAWGGHLWDGGTWSRWGKARPTVPPEPPRRRTPGPPYPRSFPPSNPSRRLPAPPPPTYWSEGPQLPSTKPSATCGDTGEPGPWRAERRPAPRCRSRAPRDPPAAVAGVAAVTGARGLRAPGRTCSAPTEVASPEAPRLYEGHAPGPLPAQTPPSRDCVHWRIGLVATPRSPP